MGVMLCGEKKLVRGSIHRLEDAGLGHSWEGWVWGCWTHAITSLQPHPAAASGQAGGSALRPEGLARALLPAPLVLEVSPAPAKIDEFIPNTVGMGTGEGTG